MAQDYFPPEFQPKVISPENFAQMLEVEFAPGTTFSDFTETFNNKGDVFLELTSGLRLYISTDKYPNVSLQEGESSASFLWKGDGKVNGKTSAFKEVMGIPQNTLINIDEYFLAMHGKINEFLANGGAVKKTKPQ